MQQNRGGRVRELDLRSHCSHPPPHTCLARICIVVWGLGFSDFEGLGSGVRVWGLGFGVWGVGSGVWGLGSGVLSLGFEIWGVGLGVGGLECEV